MRVLALDSAAEICAAAIVVDGIVCDQRTELVQQGQAARLPMLVAELAQHAPVDLVAVTVGPGSFTGLRAGLALAHGLACGWACPIIGVGVAEALVASVPPGTGPVWVALRARVGRVFLAHGPRIGSYALDDLPPIPPGAVLAGNAAGAVAARIGHGVLAARLPALADIAAIGIARHRGLLAPLAAQPLYVDAAETTLPPS